MCLPLTHVSQMVEIKDIILNNVTASRNYCESSFLITAPLIDNLVRMNFTPYAAYIPASRWENSTLTHLKFAFLVFPRTTFEEWASDISIRAFKSRGVVLLFILEFCDKKFLGSLETSMISGHLLQRGFALSDEWLHLPNKGSSDVTRCHWL